MSSTLTHWHVCQHASSYCYERLLEHSYALHKIASQVRNDNPSCWRSNFSASYDAVAAV
jgi:hypothetical protein